MLEKRVLIAEFAYSMCNRINLLAIFREVTKPSACVNARKRTSPVSRDPFSVSLS